MGANLRQVAKRLGAAGDQHLAVGDGANDLRMMAEAGLSVAFHAKPATRAKASVAISHGGLDCLLNLFEA